MRSIHTMQKSRGTTDDIMVVASDTTCATHVGLVPPFLLYSLMIATFFHPSFDPCPMRGAGTVSFPSPDDLTSPGLCSM